ncbi:paraneoplastic antigen Ma1 homolog [Pholidichthys leucotaenia]
MDIQLVHTELVKGLRQWCQGESPEEDHRLLVLVPKGVEIAKVEETLETVKALGRVRVRGRMYNNKLDWLSVLCECREKIDPTKIPSEVKDPTTDISWPVIVAVKCSTPAGDAPNSLRVLLDTAASSSSAESIIRAVGDVLLKMEKPSGENSSYRCLRAFSGTLPTPTGKEALEQWLEQAHLMVEESDCSDKEKCQCIMECLKGPALTVVKAIQTAEVDITPSKCLDAIESAFGSAESGEDLFFEFRLLQQEKNEKL